MFTPKIKEDKNDYIVYSGNIQELKEKKEIFCISIDVGVKNFAIRGEIRRDGKFFMAKFFEKISFQEEKLYEATLNPETLKTAICYIKERWKFFQKADLVVVERQLAANPPCRMIFNVVMTTLLGGLDTLKKGVVITDINPKCKGRYLYAGRGLRGNQLKEWSSEKALEICRERGDIWSEQWLKYAKGKRKSDDLADTICQLEAFFIMISE